MPGPESAGATDGSPPRGFGGGGYGAPSQRGAVETAMGYVPGPNDIVRAPERGEEGALAGINVEALRRLLNPNGLSVGGFAGSMASAGRGVVGGALGNSGKVSGGAGDVGVMQMTRHARRLYVGNLPVDTTEGQITDFFNRALIAAKGVESEGDPVISVYTNLEKRFAFIETRTVGEAAATLMLDGIKFRDVFLRLRRPNDYQGGDGNAKVPEGFNPGLLGIVSTQVSDGPNKVFIGGIPYNLNEDNIKELLQTFGALAAFNLIKEPNTGLSKGFAFFEYVDPSVVDAACNSLHGMVVGDKTLTVRRASQTGGGGGGSGAPGGMTFASAMAGGLVNGGRGISGGGVGRTGMSGEALVTKSTRVVELSNVATAEELGDKEEYEDIREVMEEEGRKFGKLEEVFMARPGEQGLQNVVGKVFLRYAKVEEAERAHATMSGRKFGDQIVSASFYDEAKFEKREF